MTDGKMRFRKIAAGFYMSNDNVFQIVRREDTGAWMLLQENEFGTFDWCQSFNTLAAAKISAFHIANWS